MKFLKLNTWLFFILFMLSACGGGTASSVSDVDQNSAKNRIQVAEIEKQLLGYWSSKAGNLPEYEFFNSSHDALFDQIIKTGRVFEAGNQVGVFHWNIVEDGTIYITLVERSCASRPLSVCSAIGRIKIVASGGSIHTATWTAQYYDINGVEGKKISSEYNKKNLDLSAFQDGKFFLTKSDVFESPDIVAGDLSNDIISIQANWYRSDRVKQKLQAHFDLKNKQYIEFASGKTTAFYENAEFLVANLGYKNFQIKSWYEDVVLSASEKDKYALRYELHREIQFPDDIDPKQVNFDNFTPIYKTTVFFNLLNKFIHGPTIKPMDKFYSLIPVGFDASRVINQAGNELLFTSNTEAVISHVDNINGAKTTTTSHTLTWSQNDDGSVTFVSPTLKSITMYFIKSVNGGYNVFYDLSEGRYVRHDLILDTAEPVVNESTLPGRYRFLSANGWQPIEIVFHKNKTVTSTPDLVSGYWFQDVNGDIVSYECTNMQQQDIVHYDECYNSFDYLGNMSFAHIRRLRFMYKDGENYQMKYSASLYGARFDAVTADQRHVSLSWTYRWQRVGNVSN